MNEVWRNIFDSELESIYNDVMLELTKRDPSTYTPDVSNIFRAFELVRPEDIKIVIVGQDPYPKKYGQHIADGLCFSSYEIQPSLKNIEKALLKSGLIKKGFSSGHLSKWAQQGILLLNKYLTHSGRQMDTFWAPFTSCILNRICRQNRDIFVCLWGNKAKEMGEYLPDNPKIHILRWAHPSPYNVKLPEEFRFENCNHFKIISRVYNIDWAI